MEGDGAFFFIIRLSFWEIAPSWIGGELTSKARFSSLKVHNSFFSFFSFFAVKYEVMISAGLTIS